MIAPTRRPTGPMLARPVTATLETTTGPARITLGLGGDATVPLSLDAAVEHASRVLALVMEARQAGGAAA